MLGFELAKTKAGAAITKLMAQYTQSAKGTHFFIGRIGIGLVELAGDTFQEFLFGIVRVKFSELLPLGILRILYKTQHVFLIESQLTIIVFRFTQRPAIGDQLPDHIVLKGKLGGFAAHISAVPLILFPSFRRRPESSKSLKTLDSGLRRNDGRGYCFSCL